MVHDSDQLKGQYSRHGDISRCWLLIHPKHPGGRCNKDMSSSNSVQERPSAPLLKSESVPTYPEVRTCPSAQSRELQLTVLPLGPPSTPRDAISALASRLPLRPKNSNQNPLDLLSPCTRQSFCSPTRSSTNLFHSPNSHPHHRARCASFLDPKENIISTSSPL